MVSRAYFGWRLSLRIMYFSDTARSSLPDDVRGCSSLPFRHLNYNSQRSDLTMSWSNLLTRMSVRVSRAVAAYRCKGRLPAVTWMDPDTKAVLARSAQPLAGLGGKS